MPNYQILRPHWSVFLMVTILFGFAPTLVTYLLIVDTENGIRQNAHVALFFAYILFFSACYYFLSVKLTILGDKVIYRYPFAKKEEVSFSGIKKIEARFGMPLHKQAYKFMQGRGMSRLHIFGEGKDELMIINLSIYDKEEISAILNVIKSRIPSLTLNTDAQRISQGRMGEFNKKIYQELIIGLLLVYGCVILLAFFKKFIGIQH